MSITDMPVRPMAQDPQIEVSKDGGVPIMVSRKAFETVYAGAGYVETARPAEKLAGSDEVPAAGKAAGKGSAPAKGKNKAAAEADAITIGES